MSQVVIVAGKGGVGKTVVSAVLARAASLMGMRTLIVEIEGRGGVAKTFGLETLAYNESTISPADSPSGAGEILARSLTPDDSLLEYFADHGMKRVSKRLVSTGVIDVVATSTPGIKDILILGKVKQLAARDDIDLVVLDAPASGHAITFLQSARAILDTVHSGPIRTQAEDVTALLEDHSRCQVMLVAIPEETPVNELVETAFSLEDRVGVSLTPLVVNGMLPELDGLDTALSDAAKAAGVKRLAKAERAALTDAAQFRRDRTDMQREQVVRLNEALPLPQFHLPFLFDADLGPLSIDELAAQLLDAIEALDPAAVLGAA